MFQDYLYNMHVWLYCAIPQNRAEPEQNLDVSHGYSHGSSSDKLINVLDCSPPLNPPRPCLNMRWSNPRMSLLKCLCLFSVSGHRLNLHQNVVYMRLELSKTRFWTGHLLEEGINSIWLSVRFEWYIIYQQWGNHAPKAYI